MSLELRRRIFFFLSFGYLTFVNAGIKKSLMDNLDQLISNEVLNDFKKQLIAKSNNISHLIIETKQRKICGVEMDVMLNWYVPEQYKSKYDKVYLTFQDITDIKNLERHMIEKNKFQEILMDIGNIALSSYNLDEFYKFCVESV